MLDESLPTFVIKPSSDKPKQNSAFFFSQHGSDFEPCYGVKHLDPDQYTSRNRYAVGIHDAYVPDILFAEVLLIPEWTQPTLSAEQIRLNGGVPPPPEPILPTEFTLQLYNPDQQINVRFKPATFTSSASWDFEIPQQTFREPSSSALDRSQDDPVASDLTPKLGFRWKKDGKFNKDMACYVSGKRQNPDGSKRKNKEPDVTVSIFKSLKEVTLYETNLARVDVEDIKGLEVVLLLSAVVIRDVYFGSMKETFHITPKAETTSPKINASSPAQGPLTNGNWQPSFSADVNGSQVKDNRIPPTDPRSQWELDVETARLKKIAADEAKERKRKDEIEQGKIKKMLEAEEKEKRQQQAELDKETARLKRLYGKEDASARPRLPARPAPPRHSSPDQRRQHSSPSIPTPSVYPNTLNGHSQPTFTPNPYMSGAAVSSQSDFLSPLPSQQPKLKQKSSFFGFRRNDQDKNRLQKKSSSVF